MSSKNVNIYLLKIINKLRIVADPNYENLTPPNLPLSGEEQSKPASAGFSLRVITAPVYVLTFPRNSLST
jgi:hypothetical protein